MKKVITTTAVMNPRKVTRSLPTRLSMWSLLRPTCTSPMRYSPSFTGTAMS